jgi:metal-responsive CopG/Arc/MetJ family transcriptional regulator
MSTERLTISLPSNLLKSLDTKLMRPDETRSAAIRRILDEALRDIDEQEQVKQWIQAYESQPQTEDEFGWMEETSLESLSELPW